MGTMIGLSLSLSNISDKDLRVQTHKHTHKHTHEHKYKITHKRSNQAKQCIVVVTTSVTVSANADNCPITLLHHSLGMTRVPLTSTPHVFVVRLLRSSDVCMAKLLLANSVSVWARPTRPAPKLQRYTQTYTHMHTHTYTRT